MAASSSSNTLRSGHRSHAISGSSGTRLVGFTNSVESSRTRADRDGVDAHAARREFLSYCLSLMRAHNNEHLDSLPILDVSALKHVAYVFDALIYFMRSGTDRAEGSELRYIFCRGFYFKLMFFVLFIGEKACLCPCGTIKT